MKDKFKQNAKNRKWLAVALAAAAGFLTAACGGGTLKLTGIPPESNGKYAVVYAVKLDASLVLVGTQAVNKAAKSVTLSRISDGTVTVPIWKVNKINGKMTRYSGNDSVDIILVGINDSKNMDSDDPSDIAANMTGAVTFIGSTKFSNGSAAKAWSEGIGGGLFGGQNFGDMLKGLGN
jgi:hypothetical protein